MDLFTLSKKELNPRLPRMSVFDIETNGWDRFLVCGHYENGRFWHFETMEDYLEHVIVYSRCEVAYAHNGGKFDFLFLLESLLRSKKIMKDYRIVKLIERGSALLSVKVEAKSHEKGEQPRRVLFSDTIAFLPYKLDTLTKTFGVQHKKLEVDHTKEKKITDELLLYLKHDCVGLYEVVEKYRTQPLIAEVGMKNTTASQAIQVFRKYIKAPIRCLSDEHDAWCREAYFGGRVEIFRPAYFGKKNKGKIRVFDVNSLYPTVMRENIFPNQPRYFTKHLNLDELSIWDVEVKVPESCQIPPLGAVIQIPSKQYTIYRGKLQTKDVKQFKFLFPVGTFRGKWTNVELKYAKNLGVEITKVHQGLIFKSAGYLFRSFIEDMYKRRLEAKRSGDVVNDTIAKLMMNSLYGRMGLDREREEVMLDDGEGPATPLACNPDLDERGFCFRLVKRPTYLESSFSNVAIAAFVTSYARIHMHKLYMELGDDLYYTDTDSVFTTRDMPTGDELGQVKLEAEGTDACFLLPKTYIMRGEKDGKEFRKAASKGMSTEYMKRYHPEDFYELYEGEAKIIEAEMKGRGLLGFRTALQRHGKLVVPKPDMIRRIMARYDKRVVYRGKDGEFRTRPVEVNGSELTLNQWKQLKRRLEREKDDE